MLWVDCNYPKTNIHLHQPSRYSTMIPIPLGKSICPLFFSSIPNVFRYMEIVSWHLLNLEEKLTFVISYVELYPNAIAVILYFLEFVQYTFWGFVANFGGGAMYFRLLRICQQNCFMSFLLIFTFCNFSFAISGIKLCERRAANSWCQTLWPKFDSFVFTIPCLGVLFGVQHYRK